ncbi:hypothetical protein EVAR_17577_1 [Eumeta japonica]|uniref:Uncharacterized protein n=1 Tax=Eumeta variegata TaxID=151549 RepID=A0A4C1UCT6_EUMVA|nr:hypothetical protein EVAR_17577_1 [Eumeta japonica]
MTLKGHQCGALPAPAGVPLHSFSPYCKLHVTSYAEVPARKAPIGQSRADAIREVKRERAFSSSAAADRKPEEKGKQLTAESEACLVQRRRRFIQNHFPWKSIRPPQKDI